MNDQTAVTGPECVCPACQGAAPDSANDRLHWCVGVYDRQRNGGELTPRQRRRALHKLNHARAPFGRKHPLAEIIETSL